MSRLSIDDLKPGMRVVCFHDDKSSHEITVTDYDLNSEWMRKQMGSSFEIVSEPRCGDNKCHGFVVEDVVEELTEAIRFTVEFVGTDTLPAIEGWSWYDALVKYAPEKAKAFVKPPLPTEVGSVIRAQYKTYNPQICLLTNNGWTDEDSDIYEFDNKDLKLIEVIYDAGQPDEEAVVSVDSRELPCSHDEVPCTGCGYDPTKYNNGFTYDRT
jgi:hypothetical protein